MKRLIYRSTARPGHTSASVTEIADNAIPRNAALGVTGVLKFDGLSFVQILEGADGAVDQLMTSIRKDPRHSNVQVLGQWPVRVRLFPDWSMRIVDGLRLDEMIRLVRASSTGANVFQVLEVFQVWQDAGRDTDGSAPAG